MFNNEGGIVKLGELGLSIDVGKFQDGSGSSRDNQVGTLEYMAPEVALCLPREYDPRKSDIFSL